jgi:putative transposase
MAHASTKVLVHFVFSTKDRRPFLTEPVSDRLNRYVAGIATNHKMHLLRAGGTADHRHLLLQLRPPVDTSEAMRVIKANSSRWVKETFAELRAFSWQTGYSAFSVAAFGFRPVIAYIDRQAQHHRKLTFEEELIGLLKRAEIEYDPNDIFD